MGEEGALPTSAVFGVPLSAPEKKTTSNQPILKNNYHYLTFGFIQTAISSTGLHRYGNICFGY